MSENHDPEIVIPAGKSREWNFHPRLPIHMSPVFDIPPKPKAAFAWLWGTWTKLTPPVNHLVWAIAVYLLFWPMMADMQTVQWEWMAKILVTNLGAVLILAGGFHAYLFILPGKKRG